MSTSCNSIHCSSGSSFFPSSSSASTSSLTSSLMSSSVSSDSPTSWTGLTLVASPSSILEPSRLSLPPLPTAFAKPRGFLAHRIAIGAAPKFLAKLPLYITGDIPSRRPVLPTPKSSPQEYDDEPLEASGTGFKTPQGFLAHRMEKRGISGRHIMNMPLYIPSPDTAPPPLLSLTDGMPMGFLEHRMAKGASRKFLCHVPDDITLPGPHPLRIQGKRVADDGRADKLLPAYPKQAHIKVPPRPILGPLPAPGPWHDSNTMSPPRAKKRKLSDTHQKALRRAPEHMYSRYLQPLKRAGYLPPPPQPAHIIGDPGKGPLGFAGAFYLRPPPANVGLRTRAPWQ